MKSGGMMILSLTLMIYEHWVCVYIHQAIIRKLNYQCQLLELECMIITGGEHRTRKLTYCRTSRTEVEVVEDQLLSGNETFSVILAMLEHHLCGVSLWNHEYLCGRL